MKRAISMAIFLSFATLAFLPGDVFGQSACSNSLFPPFVTAGVKPNVLILLDVSNSFDEDFYGNAVGSFAATSKSVVARQALQNLVQSLQTTANVGLMTFALPGDTSSNWYVHNAMPFASFNPATYCANPPSDCATYCTTGDPTAKSNCEAACPGLTTTQYQVCCTSSGSLFTSSFPDYLLSLPPNGPYAFNEPTGTRARYCGLAYPKTTKGLLSSSADPNGTYVYWNVPDPFYDTSNDGTLFGYTGSDMPYASAYSPAENASNGYAYWWDKTGTSDLGNNNGGGYTSYDTTYYFVPTDSDWALGFFNWGQKMPWYYVGQTWFSNSAPGSPQGYLHNTVGSLTNATQYNNLYNLLTSNSNNSAGYMSCGGSSANNCTHLVNAGNTPTAGALTTALSYFNGNYTGSFCTNSSGATNGAACGNNSDCSSPYSSCTSQKLASPISASCQQNFIILVTDGLPDTLLNGSQTTSISAVMPQVLTALEELSNNRPSPLPGGWTNVTHTFGSSTVNIPVQTYVLGIGSEATAGPNLDSMAVAGGTAVNGHAYYASDAEELTEALNTIAANLLGRVASGSSISILSQSQTQNGDNMLQGVFYPSKYFGTTLTYWPGYLYNWWFYNGTLNNGVSYNNIREDTVHDYILDLVQDYGLTFAFNQQTGLSIERFSDPTGSGDPNTYVDTVGLDSLTPIWEAGSQLFQQTASSRQIYTPGNNSNGSGLVNFNTSNTTLTTSPSPLGSTSNFDPCLNGSFSNLINYVMGTDISYCSNGTTFNYQTCSKNSDCTTAPYTTCVNACRSRTVGLCSNGTSFSHTPCATNSDCAGTSYPTCTQSVWKLGDIVYSTPKVQSSYYYCSVPNSNNFSSQACTTDSNCTTAPYTGSGSCQQKESVVFVGANDGMLHAFKTGILTSQGMNSSNYQVETFTGSIPDSSMGSELWAFIPQNSLPYLRCLAVPPPSTCHLYYNDLMPYITTMNENGVPKTILIGGMRLGGGSVTGPSANYCFNSSGVSNQQTCTTKSNCTAPYNSSCSSGYPTNAPTDTCTGGVTTCSNTATCFGNAPTAPSSCTGLSAYYALDITDVENPKLLWEFSHPLLGYSYSGPAIIHKWSNPTYLTGDQYYVMFLSGPTGASDGSSIQDAQAFVLTLNPNNLGISSVYYKDLGATTKNGFGGRLFTNGFSVNSDPYTDFVFFGYSSAPSGPTGAWQGGIGVVNTNNTNSTSALNPANWTWDVTTYSHIAQLPITAQVAAGQCGSQTYLFAGTGRYFFPEDNYSSTANGGVNYIMGIPFTCNNYDANCGTPAITALTQNTNACSALQNATAANNLAAAAWQINLDPASADGSFMGERLITDPTPPAMINGANNSLVSNNIVYFVTSEPTSDPCGYGGQTRVWGLNCATGGAISDQSCGGYGIPQNNLTGTLYLQTSTGAINKIDNSSSFTAEGGKATQWFTGMPPENGAQEVQPATTNARGGQLIQWIER